MNSVKGYCVLEPLIRQKILNPKSYDGEVRLNMGHIARIFDINEPVEVSDDISKVLMLVISHGDMEELVRPRVQG